MICSKEFCKYLQLYLLPISSYINEIPVKLNPEPRRIGVIHIDNGKLSIIIGSKPSLNKKSQIKPKQKSPTPNKIPIRVFLNISNHYLTFGEVFWGFCLCSIICWK